MSFGDNTLPNPFEIEDARAAEHRASEAQREHSDYLARIAGKLAQAEYLYGRLLTKRIKELHVKGDPAAGLPPLAITACERVAKGERAVAQLRRRRDELEGEVSKAKDHAYTLSKDREALGALVKWSMHRDLRTDAPPPRWDRDTGELRSEA